jgi:hypothetical protein
MARGGKRPGAGRKPKSEARQEPPVKAAENKLRDKLPELLDVALSLALEDRNERLLIYCIDRVLGKPTQPFDFYDAARRAAEERGLNPDRVIHLYEQMKRSKAS